MAIAGYTSTDIQQLRQDVQELKKLIEELQPMLDKGPRQLETWRQLERVTLRYLALARRMGLPEDAEDIIRILMRIYTVTIMIESAGTMLFTGTPYGLLMGIAALGLAHLTMLEGY